MSQLAVLLAKNSEPLKSGPIGLAVILILCVVCWFLFRSMARHMRKVREQFPGADESTESGPAEVVDADVVDADGATHVEGVPEAGRGVVVEPAANGAAAQANGERPARHPDA